MKICKTLSLAVLIIIPAIFYGQCRDVHKARWCSFIESYWEMDGQSTTAMLAPGDTNQLQIIAYKGQDYHINLCSEDEEVLQTAQWRIFEEVKERYDTTWVVVEYIDGEKFSTEKTKTLHKTVQKELFGYDLCTWTDEEGMIHQEVEWSNMGTRNVIIEVYIPMETTTQKNVKGTDMVCLGIRIDHMRTPKQGF